MSIIKTIADAVKTKLDGFDFGEPVTKRVAFQPQIAEADRSQLVVSIVPIGRLVEVLSRARLADRFTIDVGVQKKLPKDGVNDTTIDLLVEKVEGLENFLAVPNDDNRRLASYPGAILESIEIVSVVDPRHLNRRNTFTSVLRLVYFVVT